MTFKKTWTKRYATFVINRLNIIKILITLHSLQFPLKKSQSMEPDKMILSIFMGNKTSRIAKKILKNKWEKLSTCPNIYLKIYYEA